MTQVTLTWSEFTKLAQEFLQISSKLGDGWSWVSKNENEGNGYLVYNQKIAFSEAETDEISCFEKSEDKECQISDPLALTSFRSDSNEYLQVEYHIVYSISYQVPVLYFQAHKSDGSLLQLEEAWKHFRTFTPASLVNIEDKCADKIPGVRKTRADMLSILTQTDHPVLFKPYLSLHPCRTAELLAQSSNSRNMVLTFISIMGPYVQLQLRNEYGLMEAK